MRTGKVRNKATGEIIEVTATTNHPDSHHGIPVWVDSGNNAYLEADCKIDNPFYEIVDDSNADRIRLGKRIAELRAQKGMTVRQLAALAGVNYANLARLENGKYNPSIDILSRICKALDVRLDII